MDHPTSWLGGLYGRCSCNLHRYFVQVVLGRILGALASVADAMVSLFLPILLANTF